MDTLIEAQKHYERMIETAERLRTEFPEDEAIPAQIANYRFLNNRLQTLSETVFELVRQDSPTDLHCNGGNAAIGYVAIVVKQCRYDWSLDIKTQVNYNHSASFDLAWMKTPTDAARIINRAIKRFGLSCEVKEEWFKRFIYPLPK